MQSLHPREVRGKLWFGFGVAVCWYVGVFAYISNRLSNDDLDTLEREARAQLELKKQIKEEFIKE
jgi:hypothetical protein